MTEYSRIWGPRFWKWIFKFGHELPETLSASDKRNAGQFLDHFRRMIPCRECRDHWEADLKENPPALGTQREFLSWLTEARNRVAARVAMQRQPMASAMQTPCQTC